MNSLEGDHSETLSLRNTLYFKGLKAEILCFQIFLVICVAKPIYISNLTFLRLIEVLEQFDDHY